jgi:ribosomal protein L7/L12
MGLGILGGCGESAKREAPAQPPRAEMPPDEALEAVRVILERDGKIAAIKAYRERTGVGLREAKAAVDSLDD